MKVLLAILLILAVSYSANTDNSDCSGGGLTTGHTALFVSAADRCIEDICLTNMPHLLTLLGDSTTGVAVAQNQHIESSVDITLTNSVVDGNEKITDSCYVASYALLTGDGTWNTPSAATEFTAIGSHSFTITKDVYKTAANCQAVSADNYVCKYRITYGYKDIAGFSLGYKDVSISITFSDVASTNLGQYRQNQVVAAQAFTGLADVTSNVRAIVNNVTGVLAYDGAAPTPVIGDTINLKLTATGQDNQQFDTGSVTVVLTAAGIDDIPLTATGATNAVAAGNPSNYLTFSVVVNYLGEYTIKASADLVENARRRLVETDEEEIQTSVGSELTIKTELPKQENYNIIINSALIVMVLAAVVFASVQGLKYKNNKNQQQQEQIVL